LQWESRAVCREGGVDSMDEFLVELQKEMHDIEQIGIKIEKSENYMGELRAYLPAVNQRVQAIFALSDDPETGFKINREFVLQVLGDLIYGIENDDKVFLLDVLRYGLLEIYYFVSAELQG
jgi:hypothetical protein